MHEFNTPCLDRVTESSLSPSSDISIEFKTFLYPGSSFVENFANVVAVNRLAILAGVTNDGRLPRHDLVNTSQTKCFAYGLAYTPSLILL